MSKPAKHEHECGAPLTEDCDGWCSAKYDGWLTSESSASPACSIAVPVRELEKLEYERVRLYEYLTPILDELQMLGLVNITGQMWRVANTKKWD